MTRFEKCLYLWLEVNTYALEIKDKYPELEFLEVKSTDLFSSDSVLDEIASFAGFSTNGKRVERSIEKNTRNLFRLERRPIQDEWVSYKHHPEVIKLAEQLGYNMDKEEIGKFIHKYQLPEGIFPLIRNKTKYWAMREKTGNVLRFFGLRR